MNEQCFLISFGQVYTGWFGILVVSQKSNTLPEIFAKSRFSDLKYYPRLSLQKTDGWPNCILNQTGLPGRKSRIISRTYQLNTGLEVEIP